MGFAFIKVMALSSFLNFLMPLSVMANSSCEFRQELALGQVYYINNLEYPGTYPASTSCTWYGTSLPGTKIIVACEDIALPSTRNCVGDKLSISLSGNLNFQDAKNYCGTGSISLVTDGNAIAIGLFATASSSGGRFVCSVTAIQDSDGTTTAAPKVCDCGWRKGFRIVGGNETLVNEFPSMAGLVDSSTKNVFCGGTIISTRYVLTAAHCLLNVRQADLGVLVGDHNVSSGFDTESAALYKVHFLGFSRQTVTAVGWGQIFFTGPTSDVLRKVDLNVTSNSFCAQNNVGSVITTGHICTYAAGKDACQSDSGGPLFWMDTGSRRLQLVGVLSYGLGCASELPGVNTRVTSYISWIVSKTTDANYCIK
ncbi:hypothetical protein JTB14_028731 [Gonioctena quinquepunctata]|nr:hypothetical protein JTB14_028731 [Gonioctena quinquepunctata]